MLNYLPFWVLNLLQIVHLNKCSDSYTTIRLSPAAEGKLKGLQAVTSEAGTAAPILQPTFWGEQVR